MSLLIAQNISKSFVLQQVLQDVSLSVAAAEKVALVGRNGSGKSTLLRVIAGQEQADAGTISLLPRTHLGYLAQEPDLSGGGTLFTAVYAAVPRMVELERELRDLEARLEGDPANADDLYMAYAEAQEEYAHRGGPAYAGRVKATLAGLGFRESDFELAIDALSGGQRTRANLCMLLLQEPDLLLLDEPTNHLDLPAIEWLEDYLRRTRSAVLVVSHDRYFLDHLVSRVVELEDGHSYSYPGNYTAYARLREERLEQLRANWERNQEQVAKLEDYIARYRVARATMAKSREKMLARINTLERPHLNRPDMHVRLNSGLRSGEEVLRVEGLSKVFPEKTLFEDIELVVRRGDRVGIVGPNGSGKTTLLRILMDQMPSDAGRFEFGHNVQTAYFAQDLGGADPTNTLLDEMMDAGAATYEEGRNLLARFLFFGDDVFKRVADLSGGERNRLALAKMLLSHANCLLLDEPTNHLDIAARDRLEEALVGYEGTIICSSHDRYLLNRVATRIVEVSDGQARVYDGTYAEYRRRKEREKLLAEQAAARAAKAAAPQTAPETATRPRPGVRPQELRKAVKAMEERIASTETRIAELSAFLADSTNYTDGERVRQVHAEYQDLSARLPEMIAEWEQLAEAAEAIAVK